MYWRMYLRFSKKLMSVGQKRDARAFQRGLVGVQLHVLLGRPNAEGAMGLHPSRERAVQHFGFLLDGLRQHAGFLSSAHARRREVLPSRTVDSDRGQGEVVGAPERPVGRPCVTADFAMAGAVELDAIVAMLTDLEGPSQFFFEVRKSGESHR
jgi:hypothetical protein